MASPYSDDLRRKLLKAHQRGEGSLAQLAQRFDVSLGWAKKISAAFRASGAMERVRGRPRGRVSKITAEVEKDLRKWVSEQADLTLAELQVRLVERRALRVSIGRLWLVLHKLGLRLKKSHSTRPSRIPPRVSSSAVSGANKPIRSKSRS